MQTEFQKKVYKIVGRIPRGKTMSYKEIALKLKTSPRAVGQALKRNPHPYAISFGGDGRNRRSVIRGDSKRTSGFFLVPCHRVIRHDGSLGGYCGKMNSAEKMQLLKKEGVDVKN